MRVVNGRPPTHALRAPTFGGGVRTETQRLALSADNTRAPTHVEPEEETVRRMEQQGNERVAAPVHDVD
jgi:hypothetical protein